MKQVVLASRHIDWLAATDLDQHLKFDRQHVAGFGKPLFRYTLVIDKISNVLHFVWTLHHAAIDGWSLRLLLEQVENRYQCCTYSLLKPFQLYVRHISEQNKKAVEDFWFQKLAGITAKHFPSSPSNGSFVKAESSIVHHVTLPNLQNESVTISTLIQAAWALVLKQRAVPEEVVYGMVLAGRNSGPEWIETICGPTFVTVPFRLCLEPGQSGRQLMHSIRIAKSEMKPYQHLGVQNIQRLSPDCAFACKFQNLLGVQPIQEVKPDGLFANRLKESNHWTDLNTYCLLLQCQVTTDGFTAHAIFDADAIPMDEMRAILHDFESAIHFLLTNAESPLDSFESIHPKPASFKQMYSSRAPKIESTVHDFIEKQMNYQPKSIALRAWDGQLSREELRLFSTALACKLKARPTSERQIIPLLFEKSMWTVVAMMATMKVGSTLVALNATDPTERLEERLVQLGSELVLCSERCAQDFKGLAREMIVVGPNLYEEAQPTTLSFEQISPETIMYVIFTSGTTGKPKGVEIEHSACCTSLTQLTKSYAMDSHTRTLQFSSYSFDGCILEIFGTLMAGGCVCIPSEETRLDGFASFITEEQVNFAFLVPSFARTINPVDVTSLRTLIIGGEMVRQEDVNQWLGSLKLFVAYGPTECCIMCTALEVTQKAYTVGQLGPLVIGDAVVIDDLDRVASMCATGELYIGGPALVKGYFNEPALTKKAFGCSDPWTIHFGGGRDRWYKTGDLVKMHPDCTIEYLGRKDK